MMGNWGMILSVLMGILAWMSVISIAIRFRWYEVPRGRVGNQPIVEYQFGLIVLLAVGAGYLITIGSMHLLALWGVETLPGK